MPRAGLRRHEGRAAPVAADHSPVARDYPSRALGAHFRPPRCDCAIKERGRPWRGRRENEAFVLHNFFTGRSGEQVGNNVAHRLFTAGPGAWGAAGVSGNRMRTCGVGQSREFPRVAACRERRSRRGRARFGGSSRTRARVSKASPGACTREVRALRPCVGCRADRQSPGDGRTPGGKNWLPD